MLSTSFYLVIFSGKMIHIALGMVVLGFIILMLTIEGCYAIIRQETKKLLAAVCTYHYYSLTEKIFGFFINYATFSVRFWTIRIYHLSAGAWNFSVCL